MSRALRAARSRADSAAKEIRRIGYIFASEVVNGSIWNTQQNVKREKATLYPAGSVGKLA